MNDEYLLDIPQIHIFISQIKKIKYAARYPSIARCPML